MAFEVLDEGLIGEGLLTSCSRVAVVGPRELVCTYMVRSGPGISDFVPWQARSRDAGRTWTEEGRVWPELDGPESISCALSRAPNGDLFLYGTTTPVERRGESLVGRRTRRDEAERSVLGAGRVTPVARGRGRPPSSRCRFPAARRRSAR